MVNKKSKVGKSARYKKWQLRKSRTYEEGNKHTQNI